MGAVDDRFRAKLVARALGTTEVTVYPATPAEREKAAYQVKLERHYAQAAAAEKAAREPAKPAPEAKATEPEGEPKAAEPKPKK